MNKKHTSQILLDWAADLEAADRKMGTCQTGQLQSALQMLAMAAKSKQVYLDDGLLSTAQYLADANTRSPNADIRNEAAVVLEWIETVKTV
jgi:hypothetical protein